jgi:hypothetical protein
LLWGIWASINFNVTKINFNDQHNSNNSLFNYRLEDNGIITECNLKTLEAEELVSFEFDFEKVVNKIIMKVLIH